MPVGKKLAVVLSVVVTGAGAALFFRKDASGFKFWQRGSDDPFVQHVERRVTSGPGWDRPLGSTRAASSGPQAQHVAAATTAAIAQPGGPRTDGQPKFQRNLNPVGALLPPIEGVLGDDSELDTFDEATSAAEGSFASADDTLRHVVVDGDTLSNLAVQYLGSAEAYQVIFDRNRDVLASPDLLPIGAVLKIPRRSRASRGGALTPEAPLPMAPVPSKLGYAAP